MTYEPTKEESRPHCAHYGGLPARCLLLERSWAPGVTPKRCERCPEASARPAPAPDVGHAVPSFERIAAAAQEANYAYKQWMPERWLQLFYKALTKGASNG